MENGVACKKMCRVFFIFCATSILSPMKILFLQKNKCLLVIVKKANEPTSTADESEQGLA